MYRLGFLIIGLICFENANSFALLQARKQNNNLSEAEAFRKDPSEMIAETSSQIKTRRQFSDQEDTNSLESVVLAIDTGVKRFLSGQAKPDIVDTIAKSLVNFAKSSADPLYRSKGLEYNIKPELVNFKSDKPSVMFEINSKSILSVLRDLLQSKTVRKYMDKFSKEAAVVYRTIKDEINKAQEERSH